MYELSANMVWLFTEAGDGAAARCRAAAAHGLRYVEIWDWREEDLDALGAALSETGVTLQTMCTTPMGRLVDRSTHEAFLDGLRESIQVAERLRSPFLVVTAGDALPGVPPEQQRAAIVAALKAAVPLLEGHDPVLLLENLNSRVDHIGTFLDTTPQVVSVLREVASPKVKLLYDHYHSLAMGEKAREVLGDAMDLLGHVQIADVPGRHEPGTGDIDWPAELAELRSLGYTGRLGLECTLTAPTTEALGFIETIAAKA
jgi:hydroxypyruvate isomerase